MNFDPLLGDQPTYTIPQLEDEQKKLSEEYPKYRLISNRSTIY